MYRFFLFVDCLQYKDDYPMATRAVIHEYFVVFMVII